MIEGSCLCGSLHYQIDGPFIDLVHCHCTMCRKHHGAPFATWAVAPVSGFRWLGDMSALRTYASSDRSHRSFCGTCGSVAPTVDAASGFVIVPAGNLKGEIGLRPTKHMFVGSKAQWYAITDGLPEYDEFPPESKLPPIVRANIPVRAGVTHGSCLCGTVAFEIIDPPMAMLYCHCSRCRQARSSAHCANVFFKADGFSWTRGEEDVQDYALPSAQLFGTAFCRRCGSGVPRVSVERNMASVPASSLDSEPGVAPTGHIFVDSKAPWFEIADELPQFSAMPPKS